MSTTYVLAAVDDGDDVDDDDDVDDGSPVRNMNIVVRKMNLCMTAAGCRNAKDREFGKQNPLLDPSASSEIVQQKITPTYASSRPNQNES